MQSLFPKTPSDNKSQYALNLKRAAVFTLLFFNIVVLLSPRLQLQNEINETPKVVIDVEEIPRTRQMRRTPPPLKPTVPVPSEDESIPEDLTIEETTLQLTSFSELPGAPGFSGSAIIPPKPISWVFPEYPEEEKKNGVQGIVKLSIHVDSKGKVIEVVVLDNTTESEKCAQAAIQAAYDSRFLPAREGKKAVNFWISQPYRFDLSQ